MIGSRHHELPPRWTFAAVGDLACDVRYGTSAKTNDDPSGVPVLRMGNLIDGRIDFSALRYLPREHGEFPDLFLAPGDLLFNRTNSAALVGKSAVYHGSPTPCSFASYLIRLRFPSECSSEFVAWYLNSPMGRLWIASVMSQQVGQANVNGTKLKACRIPLAPPNEQRRIVAAVDSYFTRLDDADASLTRIQANLKRYRAAVLKAAVEGRLVPTEAELARREGRDYEPAPDLLERILAKRRRRWEEAELAKLKASGNAPTDDRWKQKYKEPVAPETIGLPGLPDGWCWASVDSLCVGVTDGDHQPPPQVAEGVPFLVIGDVRAGVLDFSDTRYVPESYYSSLDPIRRPEVGDVLYTVTGSFGIPVLVNTPRPFCVQRHIAILKRPIAGFAAALFVDLLESETVASQARHVATGTAQKTVPLKGLRRIAIPLPPESEQQRMLQAIERHRSLAKAVEEIAWANSKRTSALRHALLRHAFEGKLVAQDPNDELASVLLDRIRAERAAIKLKTKDTRKVKAA